MCGTVNLAGRGLKMWGVVAAGLILAATLPACGGGSSGTVSTPVTPAQPWSLRSVSESELNAYFRNALGPSSKSYLGSVWALDMVQTASGAPATAGPTFSGTTLQESGVDEDDLIKSDGVDVFNLEQPDALAFARNILRRQRLDSSTPKLMPVASLKVPFSADMRASGLYLDETRQQLAVLAQGTTSWGVYDAWFAPQRWGQGATEMVLVSSANPNQLQTRRTLRINAQLIGSRRLGATLYLVLRSYPQLPGLDPSWPTGKTASNQALLEALQAAQMLPTVSIDGGPAEPLVQASSCFVQDGNAVNSADIISLVAIDLSASTERHSARCFTGGTEAFYMSEQSLYLATTRSVYSYSGAFPVYSGQSSTDIHKFALNGLDISYRGSGNVIGHLGFEQNRKSFRFGEAQGALRVITQTGSSWGGWITSLPAPGTVPATTPSPSALVESPAHLSILQEGTLAMKLVGELPSANRPAPLGKVGEQLYASRFIGSRGYLVTYRLTDPLYVLDLSNPSDPLVAGELQVSGYSDYLFPLTDSLLLGIGKEAVADGTAGDGRFAWYQGVKLSLIDVSDPARPREAARSIVGRRGTDAVALRNHHGVALQTVGTTVRVSLPVSLHETAASYATGTPSDYFQFTRNELQKFEIDLLALSLKTRGSVASTPQVQRDIGDDRSLLWNNQVHYFQNGSWISSPW